VGFGEGVNTTSGDLKIVFDPEVTHNKSNDSIIFKAKIVNAGDGILSFSYGADAFRVKVFDEDGSRIPDSALVAGVILSLSTKNLVPRESLNFTVEWNYYTYFIGALKFRPGRYYVSGEFRSLDGYLIESSPIEMTLSPNDVTYQYNESVIVRVLATALLIFAATLFVAYLLQRRAHKIGAGDVYSYHSL
jgi:hypothetical protein